MMEQMAMKEREGAPEERGRSPGGVSAKSSTFFTSCLFTFEAFIPVSIPNTCTLDSYKSSLYSYCLLHKLHT